MVGIMGIQVQAAGGFCLYSNIFFGIRLTSACSDQAAQTIVDIFAPGVVEEIITFNYSNV
jgi:hypothetical protein